MRNKIDKAMIDKIDKIDRDSIVGVEIYYLELQNEISRILSDRLIRYMMHKVFNNVN